MRFGLQLWSQQTDWPGFRDAALAAEAAGWDSVWTWDHLLAIFGPWEQPILEGWSVLAGLGPLTSRVRLGLMVGANTFRNPGHTAKLATTLDHLSNGRAVLGIGGAWFEREHDAFGIDFGSGFGERLDRLDESVMLMRRLLDGERFSHEGRFYTMHDAICEPRPIQAHLPILVGGSGPRKTLRTVALRADAWNTSGTVEELAARLEILAAHCADAGRDLSTIEKTVSFPVILRADRPAAEATYRALLARNGVTDVGSTRSCSARRPRWPTGCGRMQRWASRRSSSECPLRTTGRRSIGWPRSRSSSARDGRRPRRRHRWREAGPRPPAGAAVGRRHVVVNTGDDTERHGLLVMPDHDAVLYMLDGRFDDERGWGIAGETWTVMDELERYGEEAWFRLGDRDFATHIARGARLGTGLR